MPVLSRRWIHGLLALPLLALTGTGIGAQATGYAQIRAFTQAARSGDLATVTRLLDSGIDPDAQSSQPGATALMSAAEAGQRPVVEALLAAGARPDKRNSDGWTALLFASTSGHEDVVRTLLKAGADPEITSPNLGGGRTALMWALGNGSVAMAQLLLDGGANVNARTSYGATPLHFAVWHDTPEQRPLVRRLLEADADPDAGHAPSYKLPANPPLRSVEGTVLGNVAGRASVELVQILLAGGAKVDARQPGWRTPLMLAAGSGNLEVVRTLLAAGADLEARDSDGRSALEHARAGSHASIAVLLQDTAGARRPVAAAP